MQRQAEDAERGRVANHAIRGYRCNRGVVCSAGTDDELANAVRVGEAIRVLRIEPFVDVVVAVEDQVGVSRVQLLPQPVAVLRGSASGAE